MLRTFHFRAGFAVLVFSITSIPALGFTEHFKGFSAGLQGGISEGIMFGGSTGFGYGLEAFYHLMPKIDVGLEMAGGGLTASTTTIGAGTVVSSGSQIFFGATGNYAVWDHLYAGVGIGIAAVSTSSTSTGFPLASQNLASNTSNAGFGFEGHVGYDYTLSMVHFGPGHLTVGPEIKFLDVISTYTNSPQLLIFANVKYIF